MKFTRNCFLITLLLTFVFPIRFLNAGTLGDLTYEINGDSVTITEIDLMAIGNVVIPSQLEGLPVATIGDKACYSRTSVTSVTLPSSIKKIGKSAFFGCEQLASCQIAEGVRTIDDSAFGLCMNLRTVTIPSTVTYLGESAFSLCESLEKINIPPGITTLSSHLFSGCTKLRECAIPDHVTRIGDQAFANTRLERVTIPPSVKTLGDSAFQNCANLRQVKLPPGMTKISNQAFSGCSALKRIYLPDHLKEIGSAAFMFTAISDLRLDGVKTIGAKAFTGCNQLVTISIPKSVEKIGDHAFSNCEKLTGARFEGDAPKMGNGVFGHSGEVDITDFTIFVEDGSTGFSTPRWLGYRLSRPRGEIAVAIRGFQRPYLQTVLQESLNFRQVRVGHKTMPAVYELTNVGNRPLTSISAQVKGEDDSDFRILLPPRTSLAPGKTTTVELTFRPRKKGKRHSTLELKSSDKDEELFKIRLTGIGIEFF